MYEGSGILTYSQSSFSFQELLLPDLKDLFHSFFLHLDKTQITTLSSSYQEKWEGLNWYRGTQYLGPSKS